MEEVKDQSFWPSGVPTKLTYKCGEKPLHEYLKLNAGAHPDKAAYLFYGNTISYKELDHSVDRFAQFLQGRPGGTLHAELSPIYHRSLCYSAYWRDRCSFKSDV